MPRRFKSVRELEEAWEAYKYDCDHQMVLTHQFSSKDKEFVSKELQHSIIYTIEGFCVFAKISRAEFNRKYAGREPYASAVTRMKEECEVDAQKKLELQVVPSRLAGMWMPSYTAKANTSPEGESPVVIYGGDELED